MVGLKQVILDFRFQMDSIEVLRKSSSSSKYSSLGEFVSGYAKKRGKTKLPPPAFNFS